MPKRLAFTVICPTLGAVQLETDNWKPERDGGNVVVHYRAMCKCGREHVGASLPGVEIKVDRTVAAQLGRDLITAVAEELGKDLMGTSDQKKFVLLLAYPQATGISDFVIVQQTD